MKRLFSFASILLVLAGLAPAQTTTTQTTLSAALTKSALTFNVASATGISGLGANNQIQTLLVVDREAMAVQSVSGTLVTVIRGYSSTRQVTHNASAVVWVGPPGGGLQGASPFFADTNRANATGSCTATSELYLPRVYLPSGDVVNCLAVGPASGSVWTTEATGTNLTANDATFFVGPGNCNGSTTGTVGSGNGSIIVDGSVAALKVAATNAAGSHEVFTCTFSVPSRLTVGKGVVINDITYFYSVQTTTATSMVASTLGSFTGPAAGTSETASSATLVTVGGTLTQTPVVGSANLTAVSAGQYYSEKVALGTPIQVTTDRQVFVFTFEIDQSASAAQIVTSPGFLVHAYLTE